MKRPVHPIHAASLVAAALAVACSVDVNTNDEGNAGDSTAASDSGGTEARAYEMHMLVADTNDAADHVDTNLVNPWGLAFGPDTYFWVANNGTSTATIYDDNGVAHDEITGGAVRLPQPPAPLATPEGDSAEDGPTGQVFNGSDGFEAAPGAPSTFIFATTAGTLLGWSADADPHTAMILVDNSAEGAQYTGLAIADTGTGTRLYAPDFPNEKIEVYDQDLAEPDLADRAFVDPDLPDGYGPFGIQVIDDMVYVAWALHDDEGEEVKGAGNGYVSAFDLDGKFVARIASAGQLNAPWGLVMAPDDFGKFGGALLVGNFGDGHITAFDADTHEMLGQLSDKDGKALAVDGLWALAFGNDRRAGESDDLYFTAGPQDEMHGLFGEIAVAGGEQEDEGGAAGGSAEY